MDTQTTPIEPQPAPAPAPAPAPSHWLTRTARSAATAARAGLLGAWAWLKREPTVALALVFVILSLAAVQLWPRVAPMPDAPPAEPATAAPDLQAQLDALRLRVIKLELEADAPPVACSAQPARAAASAAPRSAAPARPRSALAWEPITDFDAAAAAAQADPGAR